MQIDVCGVFYRIEQIDLIDNDANCLGMCIYDKTLIQIKKDMSPERKMQVLIHELTHAMLFEAGYKEHDESLVENLSIVLHQVIQANGNLMDILKDIEGEQKI